jgi:hypothetical protein
MRLFIPPVTEVLPPNSVVADDRLVPVGYEFIGNMPPVIWASAVNVQSPFFPRSPWYRAAANEIRYVRTDFRSIVSTGSCLPERRPAGFIFHVSRCGSTLVSNVLKTNPHNVVLSEADPICAVLSETLQNLSDPGRREVMKALVNIFSARGDGSGSGDYNVVIKCTAWNSLWSSDVLATWPEVPILVIIRHPVEVVMSNLKRPPLWLSRRAIPARLADVCSVSPDTDVTAMSEVEYVSFIVGTHCEALLRLLKGNCRIIDYEDLCVDALLEIGRWFGMQEGLNADLVSALAMQYSKDPTGKTRHVDDRERKRLNASTEVISAVEKWALHAYERLHDLRVTCP